MITSFYADKLKYLAFQQYLILHQGKNKQFYQAVSFVTGGIINMIKILNIWLMMGSGRGSSKCES